MRNVSGVISYGILIGVNPSIGAIWNFRYLNECRRIPLLIYETLLGVSRGSLLVRGGRGGGVTHSPSNNDPPTSMLINEDASGSLQSYCELVRLDLLSSMDVPLPHRKRLWGLRIRKRILTWDGCEMRLGQMSLGDIVTTGLPKEEAGR